MKIQIQAYSKRLQSFTEYRRGAYEFRADLPKRWHWLQRLAIRVLEKLGANQQYSRTEVTRILIDTDDIIEAASGQIEEILESGLRPGVILMGWDQLQSVRADFSRYLQMTAPVRIGQNGVMEVLGIPVYMVPHMGGVLVLPDRPHDVVDAVMGRVRHG